MALHTISLFTGVGGLDLGLRIACPEARTVCYVEGGIENAATLAARIKEGSLDDAPIWSDVRSFDGRPWCGIVDCIVGGFPCQDISVAGCGEGIVEGNRSGLWFEFARIIREVRPQFVFVENVGALLIRGLDAVLGELAESGYDAQWTVLRASDCGAPHRRERVFILAHAAQRGFGVSGEPSRRSGFADGGVEPVAYAEGSVWRSEQPEGESTGSRGTVFAGVSRPLADSRDGLIPQPRRGPEGRNGVGPAGAICEFCGYEFDADLGKYGCPNCCGEGLLGDAESGGMEGERPGGQQEPPAPAGAWLSRCPSGIFPPGPGALDEWRHILSGCPWLAPAISAEEAESHLRGVADGLADLVVYERTDALRQCGNGVVAIQAAVAFTALMRRLIEPHATELKGAP